MVTRHLEQVKDAWVSLSFLPKLHQFSSLLIWSQHLLFSSAKNRFDWDFNLIVRYRSFATTKSSWPVESSFLFTLPYYLAVSEQVTQSHGIERGISSSYNTFVSFFVCVCKINLLTCNIINSYSWQGPWTTFNPVVPRLRDLCIRVYRVMLGGVSILNAKWENPLPFRFLEASNYIKKKVSGWC